MIQGILKTQLFCELESKQAKEHAKQAVQSDFSKQGKQRVSEQTSVLSKQCKLTLVSRESKERASKRAC